MKDQQHGATWESAASDRLPDFEALATWIREKASGGEEATLEAFLRRHISALVATPDIALLLLRQARQKQMMALTLQLARHLDGIWRSSQERLTDLAHSLAMVARNSADLAQLSEVQVWIDELLVASAGAAQADSLDAATAVLANRCMDAMAIRAMATRMIAVHQAPQVVPVLQNLLANLAYLDGDDAYGLLERARDRFPGNAGISLELAKLARMRGCEGENLAQLLSNVDESGTGYRPAISWLAGVLFHSGHPELAEVEYLRLQKRGPLSLQDAQNLSHLHVRGSPGAGNETSGEHAGVALASFGKFAGYLPELCVLMDTPPTHDSPMSAGDIDDRMGSSCVNFVAQLERIDNVTLDDACQLVRVFNSVADRGYRNIAQFLLGFPHQQGRGYGRFDPNRCRAFVRGLALHICETAAFYLLRDRALAGAPEHGSMRTWLELARLAVEARLERDEPDDARYLVRELQRAAGPLGRLFLSRLEESIFLHEGNVGRATTLRALFSPALQFRALELKPWEQWRASATRREVIAHDPSRSGTFGTVGPGAQTSVWTHATEAVEVELVEAEGIEVALSFGLIHPRAGMLLPHAWHLSMGKFPYNHPDVVSREKGATILRHGRVPRRINEPVLVLANMDAVVHRNFYHWMVLILPRILWLHEHGYTKSRRLLLPVEITSWMRQTLEIIGVQDDQVHWYSSDEVLHLESACIVSPLQFASRTLLLALRSHFWRAAGVDGNDPSRANRLVYLTRETKNRRPLAQETRIAASAAEAGFDLIDPERLPLLDQVRTFATARVIAGPVGAAFTNILWMPPGGRVLAIFKEEVTLPPFLDLCLVSGQEYRWLLGRVAPGFESDHVINSPVDVSAPAAAEELRRLAAQDSSAGMGAKELQAYRLQAEACIASGRRGVLRLAPDILWLPVSENCNLRCIGCDDVVRGFSKVYMTPDEVRRILSRETGSQGYKEIDLTGGEALLHPQLDAVIDVCREMHPRARISVVSNGTVPVRGKYRDAYAKFDSIGLSIDGASKGVFEEIRAGANFEKFLQCVADVVELRRSTGRPSEIQLCFTACSLNLAELPDVIRLGRSLGVDSVYAQTMEMTVDEIRARIGHLHLDKMERHARTHLVDEARKVAGEVGIDFHFAPGLYPRAGEDGRYSQAFRDKAAALGIGVPAETDQTVRMCQYPWTQSPAVKKTKDGWRTLVCCYMSEGANRTIESAYGIGVADAASVIDMVNGPGYWDFRTALLQGRTAAECGDCSAARTHQPKRFEPLIRYLEGLGNQCGLPFPGGEAMKVSLLQSSEGISELTQLNAEIDHKWASAPSARQEALRLTGELMRMET